MIKTNFACRWLRHGLLGVAALLTALPAQAAPPDSLIQADDWWTITIPPYQILSNCKKDRVQDMARGLEQFFAVVDRSWDGTPASRSHDDTRRVYIFERREEFQSILALTPRYARRSRIRGLFLTSSDRTMLLVDASTSDYPLRVLQHELVHDLLSDRATKIPTWFNEGLAEYYGNFLTIGKEVEIGRPIPSHMEYIQQVGLLDMRDLFAVDTSSPIYNESSKVGIFYSQSYALVHYLLMGRQELKPQWRRYVELLAHGTDSMVAFEEVFGLDERGLAEELMTYVQRETWPSRRVKLGELQLAAEREPERMDPVTTLVRLGDLVRLMAEKGGNPEDARPWYAEALHRSPQSADAREAMAALDAAVGRQAAPSDRASTLAAGDSTVAPPTTPLSDAAIAEQVDAINTLIEEQRFAEAADAIERLLPRCTDPDQQEALAARVPELREAAEQQHRLDLYNAAVQAFNEGDRQVAAEILGRIKGTGSDAELEAAILKLRGMVGGTKR